MKYIHTGRMITVEKSKEDNGLYMETIEMIGSVKPSGPIKQTYKSLYRLENGGKIYVGAGGGMINEDYLSPIVLDEMGKISIISGGNMTGKKVESVEKARMPEEVILEKKTILN